MLTNVKSVFWLANMAIPQMASRGGGSVIIISSIRRAAREQRERAVRHVEGGRGGALPGARSRVGPSNVRVNTIAPGLIKTDFARALWEDEERRKKREATTPLRRLGDPRTSAALRYFSPPRRRFRHRPDDRRRRRHHHRTVNLAGDRP